MKRLIYIFLFTANLVFSQTNSNSDKQRRAIGASGIYDFQTNGFAVGVRGYLPLTNRFAISPQVNYFLPSNIVREFYAGAAFQYTFMKVKKWDVYGLAAVYYNRWQNYSNFEGKLAKLNNIAEEAGIGMMRNKGCLTPFAEGRYNFKWKEAHLQLGILFTFCDCLKQNNTTTNCPAWKY